MRKYKLMRKKIITDEGRKFCCSKFFSEVSKIGLHHDNFAQPSKMQILKKFSPAALRAAGCNYRCSLPKNTSYCRFAQQSWVAAPSGANPAKFFRRCATAYPAKTAKISPAAPIQQIFFVAARRQNQQKKTRHQQIFFPTSVTYAKSTKPVMVSETRQT